MTGYHPEYPNFVAYSAGVAVRKHREEVFDLRAHVEMASHRAIQSRCMIPDAYYIFKYYVTFLCTPGGVWSNKCIAKAFSKF